MSWTIVPLTGIRVDSLGGYLSALGILRAATGRKEWEDIRGSWRDGHFVLQSRASTFAKESLRDWVLRDWKPRPFEKWWGEAQAASKQDPNAVPRTRAWESDDRIEELDIVMVQSRRRVFNDLLGTGGNVGKRNLPSVWKTCRDLCDKPKAPAWLDHTLFGIEVELPELNSAGTWFVSSNKTFNSGQDWYREGRLSPWSFLLALEGVRLLRGGVHRRYGTRIAGKAVFPFMSRPAAPPTDGQIAHGKSEFWAPLWSKPATLTEIEALFRSGLAEVGGRPASAPHEFAVAALGAGVDSGIVAFAPFELRQTTSAQVYEAISREHIRVEGSESAQRCSDLLLPLIRSGWLDRLPREPRDGKQRGKFVGLRGPVEAGIRRVSERPDDEEAWRALLLLLARTQEKIDRNRTLREECIPLPPLPERWFDMAWPDAPVELQIARAIASIGCSAPSHGEASDETPPIVENVFGVERVSLRTFKFPAAHPARAVWHNARPLQALISVLQRRLIDADELAATPLYAARPCRSESVTRFLGGPTGIDDELIAQWIPALSLLSWKRGSSGLTSTEWSPHPLYTLIRPILDPEGLKLEGRSLFPLKDQDTRKPHAATARKLVNLILQGEIDRAVQLARRKYLAAGWRTFDPPDGELLLDGERLAAALLIPMNHQSLAKRLCKDWIFSPKHELKGALCPPSIFPRTIGKPTPSSPTDPPAW